MVQEIVQGEGKLNLRNVQIAFQHLSPLDLKRSYLLFTLMRSALLVRWGSRLVTWAFALGLPVKFLLKATLFRQFCGGESLAACQTLVGKLERWKVGVILDYAVEGKQQEGDFAATAAEVLATLEEAKGQRLPFVVFKMTALARFALLEKVSAGQPLSQAETAEWQRAEARVAGICQAAYRHKVGVLIDAEESWIQGAIDALSLAMMRQCNREEAIVYMTLQMYRSDRYAYLEALYEEAQREGFFLGVKLVRGAYLEKERLRAEALAYPSPLHPSKAATDAAYNRALGFCVARLATIAIFAGTHNEDSTALLARLSAEEGLARDDKRLAFSQLLGMSDHLTFNLAHNGFNALKLIPYGPVKETLPYLLRRAEENSAIQSQTYREWALLREEVGRRRLDPR